MQKVFTLLFNAHPLYQKCIDLVPKDTVDFKIIREQYTGNDRLCPRSASDIERIYHLKKDPSLWYIDADVVIDRWPDFEMEPGYVYLGFQGDRYDLNFIMGNNCQWFFDYMWDKYNPHRQIQWYLDAIEEVKDRVKPIPKGYFRHLALNALVELAKITGKRVSGYDYTVLYTNGEWELKLL